MDKGIVIALIIGVGIIGATILLTQGNTTSPTAPDAIQGGGTPIRDGENVSVIDGKQIITIDVKGGYLPKESIAKAGIPTIIRFNTKGTFDCSASVRIPSLDIGEMLPASGSTDIDIGTPLPGPFNGSCGMGMYAFSINFIE